MLIRFPSLAVSVHEIFAEGDGGEQDMVRIKKCNLASKGTVHNKAWDYLPISPVELFSMPDIWILLTRLARERKPLESLSM